MVFAIKTVYHNRYLCFQREKIQQYSFIGALADDVKDAYAQFERLNSKKHCDLFHIKCRYNNKYWVRVSCDQYWIVAAADEPDENTNNWTCTLFKRVDLNDGTQKTRLLHVQLGHYVTVAEIRRFSPYLFASSKEATEHPYEVLTFVNLNNLFMNRSRCVAFKDCEGKYLGASPQLNNVLPLFQFSFENPIDPKVKHEIFTTPAGIYYIKSSHYGKFWRVQREGGWVFADVEHPRDRSAMFRATHIDTDVIALYALFTPEYVRRSDDEDNGIIACMGSVTEDVDDFAKLKIIELKGDDSNLLGSEIAQLDI